jgi:hypothetical protein
MYILWFLIRSTCSSNAYSDFKDVLESTTLTLRYTTGEWFDSNFILGTNLTINRIEYCLPPDNESRLVGKSIVYRTDLLCF